MEQCKSIAVESVKVGDVIESPDGFTLHYMRVTEAPSVEAFSATSEPEVILRGVTIDAGEDWDVGEPGILYVAPGDLVEVVSA